MKRLALVSIIFSLVTPQGFAQDFGQTRAEFVRALVEATSTPFEINSCNVSLLPFLQADVGLDHPAVMHICRAYELGITRGYGDGTFRPNQTVSSSEAQIMNQRAGDFVPIPLPTKTITKQPEHVFAQREYQPRTETNGVFEQVHNSTEPEGEIIEEQKVINVVREQHSESSESSESSTTSSVIEEQSSSSAESVNRAPNTLNNPNSLTTPNTLAPPAISNADSSAALNDMLNMYRFIPDSLKENVRAAVNSRDLGRGNISRYNKGNVHLYIERDNEILVRMMVLVKGEIKVPFNEGFWKYLQNASLHNLILSYTKPLAGKEGVQASELEGEIGSAVQQFYSGSIDLKAGAHAQAQLEVDGDLKQIMTLMNFPTENLVAYIGQDLAAFDVNTGANAAIEQGKSDSNALKALKPTHYIEIVREGVWSNPFDMHKTTLTDATFYLDDGPTVGFWGKGTFDSDTFAMFYQGPPKFSKDPLDYLEAQAGFAAKEMSLDKYLKLITAYNSRFPGSQHAFAGGADAARDAVLDATFAGLDALPLDAVKVGNPRIDQVDLTSGSNFPGSEIFNAIVLGPLAQAKDGTAGPLVQIQGDGKLFNEKFGELDFAVNTSGAKGSMKGKLGIDFGSAAGQDLGDISGDVTMTAVADLNGKSMQLVGTVDAGFFGGRDVVMSMSQSSVSFRSDATCAFPFDIKGTLPVADYSGASFSSISFSPNAVVPDPVVLLSCPEDIFVLMKNGVVYAFNGTKQLVSFGADLLPENEATKLAGEGIKFAEGALTAGGEELLNVATSIPGASELNDLGQQGLDEAKQAAEKAAKEAAAAAKKAAEKAANEAARAAQQAFNESTKFVDDLTSGAASAVIDGLGSVGSAVGGAVSSVFGGGGGGGPPGFGWLMYPGTWGDVSLGHEGSGDMWILDASGQAHYGKRNSPHNYHLNKNMSGLPTDFAGFARIDADNKGRAVAVGKDGKMYYLGTNMQWRRSDNPLDYAIDIGIGGGWLYAVSTQKHPQGWPGYKMYRTRYSSGQGNWTWQEVPGAAIRIDVGSDGRPWAINSLYEVWEWRNGGWQNRSGRALDITVSNGNRAWVIGTDYSAPHGGGNIYTYERARSVPHPFKRNATLDIPAFWQLTAGRGKNIASGIGSHVFTVNSNSHLFGGTGRP